MLETGLSKKPEKALIIHPVLPLKTEKGTTRHHRKIEDLLEEAEGLVHAIHLQVSSTRIAKVARISPAQLIGKGAAEEIAKAVEEEQPVVVVVNYKLTPVQQRNLEKVWNVKVIDRTGLILEIFGERAATKEGRIQVDLALLEYQKSRLVRSWTHLERQRGGGGFMGGPGETQIELDRRAITDRIVQLKKDLTQVRRTRELGRKNREKVPFPVVALVGYTNAGKSTLFNKLTGASVFAEDLVFATLDPTLRRLPLPNGKMVILSDTVGFIADLPTTLVEAFRATLEQVQYADIILHVRDVSSHDHPWQRQDVINVLTELGIDYDHDERIYEVLNKIDMVSEEDLADIRRDAKFSEEREILVSAITGEGLDALLGQIARHLSRADAVCVYDIPSSDGRAMAWLHKEGDVMEQAGEGGNMLVKVRLSADNQGRFEARFPYSCRT
ncbi:MAG: GTPase HflX [Micavibrio aeruginosavorus]|uniref:GTPase HflX n=1 Tax=Micavibrio aeruginosavorus TaxID=349221 RepID=A0A2W5N604_9BACT|nr:MAG: GTPase HflX [Micavibrio aeruginosavorus]